jgi:hypothetical protein
MPSKGDTLTMPEDKIAPSPRDELRTLANRLREQAQQLGDADAIAAADTLHEHANRDEPNAAHIRAVLTRLEAKIALSPTVSAILEALSSVGM